MAKTVNTSAATLLTVAEFLKRCDHRTVGDLVADTGTRVTEANLASDANLAACLLDALGELEGACLVGGRYTPADLAALTGASRAKLYRILTRLTVVLLFERRPDRELKLPWVYEQALEDLQALRDGERVFSFQETMDAGVPTTRTEDAGDVEDRNGATIQAQRFFGRRSNRP